MRCQGDVVPAAAVVVIVILFEVDDDGFVLLIDFTGLYHVFVLLVLCVCAAREFSAHFEVWGFSWLFHVVSDFAVKGFLVP